MSVIPPALEFSANYQRFTPEATALLMRISTALGAIAGARVLPAIADELRASARVGTVHYSNLIEGNELPVIDAERATRGALAPDTRAKIELVNYVAALDLLDARFDSGTLELTPEFLKRVYPRMKKALEYLILQDGKDAGAVKPYDFAAQRINRTQLPLLDVVNKAFAARACQSLSGLLGRDATVHFDSMESVKSSDMQASLPTPATLAVIRLKPLNGFAYVSVEPQLLLTLLDGFFGGSGRATSDSQGAIAPAAQRFLALVLRTFAADLTAAWTPVAPPSLDLHRIINP